LQHAEVVVCFLFPSDQQASKAVGPRMSSFDDPSSGSKPLVAALRNFLSAGFHMRLIVPTPQEVANVLGVIAFVEANILMTFRRRLWAFYRDAVKSLFDKLDVVCVGTADFNTQWDTTRISKNGSLGA